MGDSFATVVREFDEELQAILNLRHSFYHRLVREAYNGDDYVANASEDEVLQFYFKCPCALYRFCGHLPKDAPTPIMVPWCPMELEVKYFQDVQPFFEQYNINLFYKCKDCMDIGCEDVFSYICGVSTVADVCQQYDKAREWLVSLDLEV